LTKRFSIHFSISVEKNSTFILLQSEHVLIVRVYIATKNDTEKEIQIFDVLGKKVFYTQLNSRELNLTSLSPGVYIIKIREEESSATRKLIIR
jgi:hypothetical protein